MVQIKRNHLVIELDHPFPEEALKDLQTGIIEALLYQFANPDEILPSDEQRDGNCMLLELLKTTLETVNSL